MELQLTGQQPIVAAAAAGRCHCRHRDVAVRQLLFPIKYALRFDVESLGLFEQFNRRLAFACFSLQI